ncbi:MAG: hypothetical protein WC437_05140 [Patescibacteria group bacterium]
MITISKDEAETIKRAQALPKRIIEDRIKELTDELLTCQSETLLKKRGVVLELRNWLATINLFEKKPDNKKKKDNFV